MLTQTARLLILSASQWELEGRKGCSVQALIPGDESGTFRGYRVVGLSADYDFFGSLQRFQIPLPAFVLVHFSLGMGKGGKASLKIVGLPLPGGKPEFQPMLQDLFLNEEIGSLAL